MTRRIFLTVILCVVAPLVAHAAEPIKVLLIGRSPDHPPQTHEYLFECNLLAKCLEQTPGIEAIVSDGWPTDPATLDGVKAIVLYTAVGGDVLHDPSRAERVKKLLASDVGLVALHWGTGASVDERGDASIQSIGGFANLAFTSIPVTDAEIEPADPDHPISRGWSKTPMHDEYYLNLRFNEAIHPVIRADVEGKSHTLGWTLERPGGGRSFGYVCGHFHDCFKIPAFRRSVVNGILWSAGVEVPEAGAPVGASEADLTLPPDPRPQP